MDNKNSTTKWAAKCLGTKYRPSAFIVKKGVFQGQEPRNWGHNHEKMNLESIQCIKMDYLRPNFFSLEVVSRHIICPIYISKKYALASCIHEKVQQEYNWNMRKRILDIYIDRKGHLGFQGQLIGVHISWPFKTLKVNLMFF